MADKNHIIEPRRPGQFLVSEANGRRSRASIVIALGQLLLAGAVLGKVLLGGSAAASAAGGGNTGNGTITGLAVTGAAKIGAYTLTCKTAAANAGVFSVVDPDGEVLDDATVAVAYSHEGLSFTIGDGGTDYIVGDTFTITVTPAVAAAVAGNTGNGTIGTVTVSTGAKAGVYRVVAMEPATNAGKFTVEDPDGILIGVATVAVAFATGGLSFTIADGSTDFASGDSFTITVAEGSGEYRAVNPSAKDGSQIAAGILWRGEDATEEAQDGVAIVRDAEYNEEMLVWPDGTTDNQKATAKKQLAAAGIIARGGIGEELDR